MEAVSATQTPKIKASEPLLSAIDARKSGPTLLTSSRTKTRCLSQKQATLVSEEDGLSGDGQAAEEVMYVKRREVEQKGQELERCKQKRYTSQH